MLRFASLLVSFIIAPAVGHKVAVAWLSLTWISTVILGVPIATTILGDSARGRFYGLLAGISSFIFQLPLMLFLFERDVVLNEPTSGVPASNDNENDNTHQLEIDDGEAKEAVRPPRSMLGDLDCSNHLTEQVVSQDEASAALPSLGRSKLAGDKRGCTRILRKIVRNPIMAAIVVSLVLSLTKIGRYLNPSDPDHYVEALGFIATTLEWLGDCVSPVSLLTMGLWMQSQGFSKLATALPVHNIVLLMFSKLIVVPLLMVGLAHVVALNNEAGRVSVLIASLPISLASFTLGHQYGVGEAALAANVAIGTLLMLPTVLVWNVVLDAFGLYPIET